MGQLLAAHTRQTQVAHILQQRTMKKRNVYSHGNLMKAISARKIGMSWNTVCELFSTIPDKNDPPTRYATALWCANQNNRLTARSFPRNQKRPPDVDRMDTAKGFPCYARNGTQQSKRGVPRVFTVRCNGWPSGRRWFK